MLSEKSKIVFFLFDLKINTCNVRLIIIMSDTNRNLLYIYSIYVYHSLTRVLEVITDLLVGRHLRPT